MERLFPMYVKLSGHSVLVVGAGKAAESKIEGLLDTGAQIRVVALEATSRVQNWAKSNVIGFEQRAFVASDLDGIFLVIVATSSSAVNRAIFRAAESRSILCNVVDVPELCDFFYPAVLRRGDLQIAISTAGQSPCLAQSIRQKLEKQFGPRFGEWVAELGETRREVLRSHLEPEEKRFLLQSFASRNALEVTVAAKRSPESRGEAV